MMKKKKNEKKLITNMTLESEVILKEEIACKSFTIQTYTHTLHSRNTNERDHLVTLIISLSFSATN